MIGKLTSQLLLSRQFSIQLSREAIEHMSFDELHAFVQAKGFQKVKSLQQEEHEEQNTEGLQPASGHVLVRYSSVLSTTIGLLLLPDGCSLQ